MIAWRRTLTVEESLVGLAFVALATLAFLMPTHNDTWWHLRSGQEMVRTHALLFDDRFSFTAHGSFFWNHSWLSQLLFYAVFAIGGLPLLTTACAILVVVAWALVWRLMRGDIVTRTVFFAIALSSATSIWSVRPQVFSIVLLPVVVRLAMEDRWRLIVPVMAVWANLHAGFAMGLAVLGAAVLAALIVDRNRLLIRIVGTAAAATATLINPMGARNWVELFRSTGRSRANQIQEWMAPSFEGHLIFWLIAATFVYVVLARWKRLRTPGDRVLAVAALVVLVLAVRTLRNIPAFTMLMAPALSQLIAPVPEAQAANRIVRRGSILATAVVAVAALCGYDRRGGHLARAMATSWMGSHLARSGAGHLGVSGPSLQPIRSRRLDHLVRTRSTRFSGQPPGSVSNLGGAGGHSGRSHGRLSSPVRQVWLQLRRRAAGVTRGAGASPKWMVDRIQRLSVDGAYEATVVARSDPVS